MPEAPNASLPMLVADLAEEGVRDFLTGVALAEQVAFVPLLAPPADRSTHTLEVYSPESPDPLRLLADPVGPPTPDGYPLRLRLSNRPSGHLGLRPNDPDRRTARPATFRARRPTDHALTDRHTANLQGEAPAAATTRAHIGRTLSNGKLQIESLIGGGGVGAVFRARHLGLNMPVAVKVLHDSRQLDADFGRRFHAEALAASRLSHPNVTRVLDFGQEPDGLLYLVMEYLEGVGLRELLDREGPFDTARIVRLASQICGGLAHAHGRSIVHKDVKPENLVVVMGDDDDGEPIEIIKVCDFGIAQGAVVEEKRRFQGTPAYMSPEQCSGGDLDARSDIYSVGVVMYELVTGDVPFCGGDVRTTLAQHLHEIPTPPSQLAPGVDPRLERIILKAMAKERDARYPSLRDLRAALRGLLDEPLRTLSGQLEKAVPELARPSARPQRSTPSIEGSGDWLVRGGSYADIFEIGSAPPPASSRVPPASPKVLLMQDPAAFMRRLVATQDPAAFATLAHALEPAIAELAEALEVETLWRLASTLEVLATEGPETPGSRAAMARGLLRIVRDPGALAPIAQRVLGAEAPTGERLLVAAGAFGAHALYSARVRMGEPEVRARFTKALCAIGPAALPVLRGGLERVRDRLDDMRAVHIAEDLLASLPESKDDELGALVASYASSEHPTLARLATAVLPALWGERARPWMLGLLDHDDPEVVTAALRGLARLGISDEHTPRRIARVLDQATNAAIRTAAIQALTHGRSGARPIAAQLLAERGLTPRSE